MGSDLMERVRARPGTDEVRHVLGDANCASDDSARDLNTIERNWLSAELVRLNAPKGEWLSGEFVMAEIALALVISRESLGGCVTDDKVALERERFRWCLSDDRVEFKLRESFPWTFASPGKGIVDENALSVGVVIPEVLADDEEDWDIYMVK